MISFKFIHTNIYILQEPLNLTHTHTHIYIYIYILGDLLTNIYINEFIHTRTHIYRKWFGPLMAIPNSLTLSLKYFKKIH